MKFAAVDIGASSGRVIEFEYLQDHLIMKECHRFKNEMILKNDSYHWDIHSIVNNVIEGLKKCDNCSYIGIDTWAVDYICLNKGELFELPYAYRDNRTLILKTKFDSKTLFTITGLGYLPFNTIYQLEASSNLDGYFMMIPDYIGYCLTGKMSLEYTNAVTTQLIDLKTKTVSLELIDLLGQKNLKFPAVTQMGIFPLKDNIVKTIGYNAKLCQAATHDTASAFLGSADLEKSIIISLGTWSIVGCLQDKAITSDEAFELGFSNEASLNYKYRFQKNTMGTWMFEQLRKELKCTLSYEEIISEINDSNYSQIIDVDQICFLNPSSMYNAINDCLIKLKIPLPTNNCEYYKLVFDSMILKYCDIISTINKIVENPYQKINIVGGGSQNSYICKKISEEMKMPVLSGPVEATAFGNVYAQMLASKTINDYKSYQKILKNSVKIKKYKEY